MTTQTRIEQLTALLPDPPVAGGAGKGRTAPDARAAAAALVARAGAAGAERAFAGVEWTAEAKAAEAQRLAELLGPLPADAQADHAAAVAYGRGRQELGLPPVWHAIRLAHALDAMLASAAEEAGRRGRRAIGQARGIARRLAGDAAIALDAHLEGHEDALLRAQGLKIADYLDAEMRSTVRDIIGSGERVGESAGEVAEVAGQVTANARAVAESAEDASENAAAVAAASEELAASSREIGSMVGRSAEVAGEAAAEARASDRTVRGLAEAVARIETVLALIGDIAKQTNLLSLNATIEAARAGEAGRGFAVVAGEVRTLAGQTAEAAEEIRSHIAGVQTVSAEVGEAIGRFARTIEEVDGIARSVTDAVETQTAATAEISRNAQEAAGSIRGVSGRIGEIGEAARTSEDLAATVRTHSDAAGRKSQDLKRRLTVLMRSGEVGNRRRHRRYPINLRTTGEVNGRAIHGTVENVSLGGAFLNTEAQAAAGSPIRLVLPAVDALPGKVAGCEARGLRIAFALDPGLEDRLADYLRRLEAGDKPFVDKAVATAKEIAAALEGALSRGEIAAADLFDDDYKPVPGTDPQQVLTRFTELTDRLLPPIQEPVLAFDRKVVFCAAVDRNGYLPTHNRKYSQPQGADPVWNNANCRNRRIFDDPVGLTDARNTNEHLFQAYLRDMGGGRWVHMKNVSAPIWVQGKHWGAFRIGYSAE
jgi:methyl-accepting chemotaxis protein